MALDGSEWAEGRVMEREMKTHRLKTLPEYWDESASGNKPFEIRFNDRDFCAGDYVTLVNTEDGRELHREISYILFDFELGLKPGYAILGLREMTK
jgi:hypothetical protein